MFVVYTKNGSKYEMYGKCNRIDYNDAHYLRCYIEDEQGVKRLLCMFPHDLVERVENVV